MVIGVCPHARSLAGTRSTGSKQGASELIPVHLFRPLLLAAHMRAFVPNSNALLLLHRYGGLVAVQDVNKLLPADHFSPGE